MSIPKPTNLRVEYLVKPLGVDTAAPRFSWYLNHPARNQSQKAYQLIVSPDYEEIRKCIGSQWDSGRTESGETVNVVYAGAPLASASLYYWRVRWWDANAKESAYSERSCFGTGLLKPEDWKAQWLSKKNSTTFETVFQTGFGAEMHVSQCHAVYVRHTFKVGKRVKHACVYVSGLGYYELRTNGQKVGDHVLDPGQTDYHRLALYSSYDVTNLLRVGTNSIGLILGNGQHYETFGYGKPRGIVQLVIEYEDGQRDVIVSGKDWKASHGPLMENGIYYGERYDARKEMPGWDTPDFDDTKWEEAEIVDGPPLASQLMPPIRATRTLKPQRIVRPQPGIFIFDFGQNFSGWVRLTVEGPAGTETTLRFSELLNEENMLNTSTLRNARATDTYILKGGGEERFEPRFTYHGFRYVEMTGFPGVPTLENLEGVFVHSDVEQTGRFHCSNQLINRIHQNTRWGQLSNLMSIPTDCPQRDERLGWMGDGQLIAEEAFYNLGMAPLFCKYLRDIRLAQKEHGGLSSVVPPYWSLYPADPAWGSAYVSIAWYCYLFTGDTRVIEEHFEPMKRYIGFLKSCSEGNIIRTLGQFGDWCPPGSILPTKTSVEFTSTWYYYHDTLLLARIAGVLGNKDEAAELSALADEIRNAFNREFHETGRYATIRNGPLSDIYISQTSQVLPLYLHMSPDGQEENAVRILTHAVVEQSDCHVDTGIVGTRYLFDVLTEHGLGEIAYKVATQRTYPGWGYMIEEGATTLWERWEKLEEKGMNSHNHIMFGSIDAWFYRVIAGLAPAEPSWKRIRIKPHVLGDLTHATATVKTVRGEAHVSWEKTEDALRLCAGIPVNVTADLYIPAVGETCTIREAGAILWAEGRAAGKVEGLTPVATANGYVHIVAGSGFYEFEVCK